MFTFLRKPLGLAALIGLLGGAAPSEAAPPPRPLPPASRGYRPAPIPPVYRPVLPPVVRPVPPVKPAVDVRPPLPPIGRDPRTWSPYPVRPVGPPIGSDPRTWSPYPVRPVWPPIGSDPRTWSPYPRYPGPWAWSYYYPVYYPYNPYLPVGRWTGTLDNPYLLDEAGLGRGR